MCSLYGKAALLCLVLCAGCSRPATPRILRMCADPNNLPFSNRAGEGFENRIAELMGRELGARVEYTWFAQRRGFVRNTLRAGLCDAIAGVPAGLDAVETTRPYYRSTFVFLTREGGRPAPSSLDDAALKRVRIGVHMIGDDYANTPPAHALGRRGIVRNVSGFSIYGDYAEPNPPARLVEAVAAGQIDVAIVWGPLAGYFAPLQSTPLRVTPIHADDDGPALPLSYAIAMGVRKGNHELRNELQRVLDRRRDEVEAILREFHVPLRPLMGVYR